MFKLPHNCMLSYASNIMLKILQARLQQYVNWVFPDVQAGFRKGRGTRDQDANIHLFYHNKSKIIPGKKKTYFFSMTMLKPLTMWLTTNCGKFLNPSMGFSRQEYWNRLPLPSLTADLTSDNFIYKMGLIYLGDA